MADQQPIAKGSGANNANVAQNVVVNPAAQHAAAQLAQQILANTNVTLRQEIVKIPEYYGEKTKDTVSAQEFINRIDECQVSNDWNDTTTYANFWLCLRGEAEEWLSSTVRHLKLTPAQKTWTRLRPLFKKEFATSSDDKLIIDGLANFAHKHGENPRKLFSRLEKLCNVLHENYASYQIKPERPNPLNDGHFTKDALTRFANDSVEAYNKFLFTQIFKAAAPENVRKLLSHKDQTCLTVDDAYQTFFTEHRVEQDKRQATATTIHAIEESVVNDAGIDDPNVAAFQPQRRQQQQFRGNNRGRGQNSSYRGNFSNRPQQIQNQNTYKGSNASTNGKFCVYCKILNHTQEECRKRKKDNKPCVNNKGQLYWPKINNINTQNTQNQQNDSNNEVYSVFQSRASWIPSWALQVSFRNWF